MPAPYRRFVHQQHPSGSGAATLRYPLGVVSHQPHDPMPAHPMMAGHRPNRHHPRILDQAPGKPASQPGLELGMLLEVTLLTVPTPEPSAAPNQSGTTAAHPKVTDPLRSPVPHLGAAEPTVRAPRPLPSRPHLNLQAVNRIDQHLHHPNTRQVQTNRHNIRHRGLPGPANCYFTDSSEASTPNQGFHPTQPTFSRRAHIAGRALDQRTISRNGP